MGTTPTDPVEFRKCARDLKALSAVKEYTNEERGGGRDPGVRRPGAGRGQFPARSKIFHSLSFSFYTPIFFSSFQFLFPCRHRYFTFRIQRLKAGLKCVQLKSLTGQRLIETEGALLFAVVRTAQCAAQVLQLRWLMMQQSQRSRHLQRLK